MKKTIKFLGIAVLVAVIGFSMAGCGDKGGGGAKYSGLLFVLDTGSSTNQFNNSAIFPSLSPDGTLKFITTSDFADLDSRFTAGYLAAQATNPALIEIVADEDSISTVKTNLNDSGQLSTAEVDSIINKLTADDYVVAYKTVTGKVGVLSITKE